MRAIQIMNFEDAIVVIGSPVFEPTKKPEKVGAIALAPAFVSRMMQLESATGAVIDHALVDPVMN